MPSQIDSDKILMKELFQRWFRVPEYQRPYKWESEEVGELLDDVAAAQSSNPTSQYFLGSVVFQTRERLDSAGNPYTEHDLLDGQQRLTTCLLLHAVGRDMATDPLLKKSCSEAVHQRANPFDGTPERLRIIYDIRSDVVTFINDYLKSDGGTDNVAGLLPLSAGSPDISIKNMAAAILQIREYFTDRPEQLNPFFQFLRNNVLLIYVSSTQLEDAFRLFVVLNDRGMKLQGGDILKSLNLQALHVEHVPEAEIRSKAQFWEEMENELGDDLELFLGHVRTVLVKEQARKTMLEEYEEKIYGVTPPLVRKGRDTFDLLDKYRTHYSEITSGSNHDPASGYMFSNLISLLRENARADYWMPPLLYYKSVFGASDLAPFLKLLDNKFMAGWVMRHTPSTRSEAMNRILRDLEKIHVQPGRTSDEKRQDALALPSLQWDIAEVLDRLDRGEIYGQPYQQYILYKLDLIIGGINNMLQPRKYTSVEHILPRNPATTSQWSTDFTDDERSSWINRLGNLVLIGRRKNTSLGRKDFADKKQAYFENHVQMFPNTVRVLNQYQDWKPQNLIDNHKKSIAVLDGWCR